MSETVISVEKLGKLYYIHTAYQNMLREVIISAFRATLKKFKRGFTSRHKEDDALWALKDISFGVKKGEVVGVIGRNGAGKTTLLKILTRITPPSEGCARIYGRVASLLEIGTGFHGELTGRENIYFNGALLGMKNKEIEQKLDEIVAFAELEKFLDMPVKHYSSGMYVRLAFAVAAHLEPEILLVDEVLAVGDSVFQKKCLGKMGDVAKGGRTVLFVSHQLNQIRRLCERCIWLEGGRIKKMGTTVEVISAYELSLSSLALAQDAGQKGRDANIAATFFKWEISKPIHQQPNVLVETGPVTLRFMLKVNKSIHNGSHSIFLFSNDNQLIWGTCVNKVTVEVGTHAFTYELPSLPLKPSTYFWRVSLYDDNDQLVDTWDCLPELIIATPPTHTRDEWAGILNLPCSLQIVPA